MQEPGAQCGWEDLTTMGNAEDGKRCPSEESTSHSPAEGLTCYRKKTEGLTYGEQEVDEQTD